MMSGDIAGESVNGGKPNVARGHTVMALSLQISEKCQYSIRLDVIEIQIANLKLSIRGHEAKQQDQAVPITANGVRAHSAKPWQVICEVVPQTGSEAIRCSGLHRCP